MNKLRNIIFICSFWVFQLVYGQCPLINLTNDLVDASEDFKSIVNTNSGFDAYRVLGLAEEAKEVRVAKDVLEDVSQYLSSNSKSVENVATEIKNAGGYVKWKLAKKGDDLSKYINLLESLKYKRVKRVLSNNEITTLKKSLEKAHPDVLKYIDELDEIDFVQMIKAYKDNPNKFNLSINKSVDFIGTESRAGFLTFWKLTPKMKDGLSTIRKLKNEGKLLPTGTATDIQLASIQNYTAWGNFVNIPMRYGVHFGKYAERAKRHIEQGLDLLRKVPSRNKRNSRVFSGRAYSQTEFNNLFVGKKGMEVEINKGFVSSSLSEDVATHFANITSSTTNNIKVIRRIKTKTGVYLDDLADYGENLGHIRHADQPPVAQIQKEVLMKEGLFKQTSNPIPFTGTDGKTWYYIDFVELGKPLK